MSVTVLKRIFKFRQMELQDPDPKLSPDQVLDLYADAYTELTGAVIAGPDYTEAGEVYTFKAAVETKGITLGEIAEQQPAQTVSANPDTVANLIETFVSGSLRPMYTQEMPILPHSSALEPIC